ncbi:MAG: tol-pal system protein YbgF, partial [Hyphomicrobiales bacterium]|nr:tol-pal system protein YbgF [Hyphomicrobiales bacterium]
MSRFGRAGAVALCLSFLGVATASAFDLNPFSHNAPPEVAQSDAPPGSIPGVADAGDAGALDVRIDRLENELRQANGRIEELENQQHRLEELVKRFQQDVEFRLSGSGGAPRGAGAPAAPAPAPIAAVPPAADAPAARPATRRGDAFDPAANPDAVGSPRPLGSTPPSAPLELAGARPEPPPAPAAPVAPAAVAPPAGALPGEGAPATIAGAGVGFTDGPRDQYNAAIEAYRNGQYAQAEEQLKSFLSTNGGNRLAPDAVFYLGETYFQRSRPREAAEQYLKLSTDYAKSARAPEGMLRLGQSLALLGSGEQACATFAEVGRRYPTASP